MLAPETLEQIAAAVEISLRQEVEAARAIELMNAWACKPLPLSAAAYDGVAVYARLAGSAVSVASACVEIGGHEADSQFWEDLREQRLPYFLVSGPCGAYRHPRRQLLWRLQGSGSSTGVAHTAG